MFIQTENTPNPSAIKFLPGTDVSSIEPVHFSNKEDTIAKSALAFKLFNIQNVRSVFFGSNFITITKSDESDWAILKPEILMTIMDHLVAGLPIFDDTTTKTRNSNINTLELSEIEKQIIEIIETRVRPSVAMDGGDIIYRGFENGIVKLELRGACSGCPSSTVTLKNGIESMLKHFIPEVVSVESVTEE
jgi:NFU1 iron-sulfur cluster scaffold homolog, mitochondrial